VARERGQLQGELFAGADTGAAAEPVLMALNAEFYELIWRGLKTHEFRRSGQPVGRPGHHRVPIDGFARATPAADVAGGRPASSTGRPGGISGNDLSPT
jgi:hypothetical protein